MSLINSTVPSDIEFKPKGKSSQDSDLTIGGKRFWTDWDPLQKYNFVLFIVHVILTVVIWFYLTSVISSDTTPEGINLDLFDHIFNADVNSNTFEVVSQRALAVGEQGVANLIASFFAVTAGFHLLYALNPGDVYLKAVRNGNNYLRWLEYSISATIMIIIIALLSGVKDIKTFFVLTTSAIGMIATGQWFETSMGNARWIPIIVGFVLLAGIFATVFASFQNRLDDARRAGYDLPGWLWAIVVVLFIFYASFGFVPIAQMFFKGNYRRYEYAYLTLSLLSKATLGILVATGFGQRTQSQTPTKTRSSANFDPTKPLVGNSSAVPQVPVSVSYRDAWDF